MSNSNSFQLFKSNFMGQFGQPKLDQRTTYYAIACYVVSILPLLSYLPVWMSVFLLGAAVYRRCMLHYNGLQVPKFFAAFVFFIFVVTTLLSYGVLWGKDAGGLLFCGLYGLKLLETHNRKDYYVLITFSYFLLALSLLFSQSIIMCLFVLIQFGWVTYCLLEGHRSSRSSKVKSMKLLFKIILMAMPLVVFLYLFFPRIQTPLAITVLDGKSGFSEEVAPGSVTRMISDPRPAFRVTFPDGQIPSHSELYWRGTVLWRTLDGMKWVRGEGIRQHEPTLQVISDVDHEDLRSDFDRIYRQEILLLPHYEEWLMALDFPVAIPSYSRGYAGRIIAYPNKVRKKIRYEVISSSDSSSKDASEAFLEKALELPYRSTLSNRVVRLVQDLRASANEEEIVQNILDYYADNEFQYTLNPAVLSGDALDAFLFEEREGYCEHYSASFATLARACGLPARIVVGYMGGQWNDYGQFMMVRQQDAHVWNEVWLKGRGWVRVDPTSVVSPERIESGINNLRESMGSGLIFSVGENEFEVFKPGWMPEWLSKPLDETSARWDQANAKWDDFLGYDASRQLSVVQRLGFSPSNALMVLILAMIFGSIFLLMLMNWSIFRKKNKDPVLQEYEELAAYLRKNDLSPQKAEGAFTYLNRIKGNLDGSKQLSLEHFRDLYLILRYGEISDLTAISQAVKELKKLRKQVCS
ncbi:MAG: DUF3488 and transglutaminase-like domain-containing protein [Verrucomicrobiota bacterium]